MRMKNGMMTDSPLHKIERSFLAMSGLTKLHLFEFLHGSEEEHAMLAVWLGTCKTPLAVINGPPVWTLGVGKVPIPGSADTIWLVGILETEMGTNEDMLGAGAVPTL